MLDTSDHQQLARELHQQRTYFSTLATRLEAEYLSDTQPAVEAKRVMGGIDCLCAALDGRLQADCPDADSGLYVVPAIPINYSH